MGEGNLYRYQFLTSREVGNYTEMSKKTGVPATVLKEAREAVVAAYKNPAIQNIKPSMTCIITERDCSNVPEGESKSNSDYDPNGQKKSNAQEKDNKSAENPKA